MQSPWEQDQAALELAASGDEPGELGRQDGQGELLPAREPRCTPGFPLQDAQLVAQQHDLEIVPVRCSPPACDQIHQERDRVSKDQPDHDSLAYRCHATANGPHCRRKSNGWGASQTLKPSSVPTAFMHITGTATCWKARVPQVHSPFALAIGEATAPRAGCQVHPQTVLARAQVPARVGHR